MVEVNEKSQPGKVQCLERSEPHFIKNRFMNLEHTLWLVDLSTYQVVAKIPVNGDPDLAMSPDGTKIVGVNNWALSGEAFIISLESKAITAVYEVNNNFPRVVVTPDGKKAIALRSNNPYAGGDNALYVIPMVQP